MDSTQATLSKARSSDIDWTYSSLPQDSSQHVPNSSTFAQMIESIERNTSISPQRAQMDKIWRRDQLERVKLSYRIDNHASMYVHSHIHVTISREIFAVRVRVGVCRHRNQLETTHKVLPTTGIRASELASSDAIFATSMRHTAETMKTSVEIDRAM